MLKARYSKTDVCNNALMSIYWYEKVVEHHLISKKRHIARMDIISICPYRSDNEWCFICGKKRNFPESEMRIYLNICECTFIKSDCDCTQIWSKYYDMMNMIFQNTTFCHQRISGLVWNNFLMFSFSFS